MIYAGAHGVEVTVVRNGLRDLCSNNGQGCLLFT